MRRDTNTVSVGTLLPGEHEPDRSHPDEIWGEQVAIGIGVTPKLDLGPALDKVEDFLLSHCWCSFRPRCGSCFRGIPAVRVDGPRGAWGWPQPVWPALPPSTDGFADHHVLDPQRRSRHAAANRATSRRARRSPPSADQDPRRGAMCRTGDAQWALRSAVERGSGTRPGIRTQVRGLRLAPRAVNA